MAEKLLMLALSPTMEEGVISKWNKQEGDQVASGDVLCEVETDKAVMDYESSADGTLLKIVKPEGESASVGELIGIIGEEGEDIAAMLSQAEQEKPAAEEKETDKKSAKDDKEEPEAAAEASAESGESKQSAEASGFIKASPLARKLAQQNDLKLAEISGSGPAGRIVKADIEKALESGDNTAKDKAKKPSSVQARQTLPAKDEVIPVSSKRRIIAQRLSESKFSAPHYYLKVRVEMDDILEARRKINSKSEIKVSLNAFIIKFAAEALKRHPAVNSSWAGDKIIRHGRIDIGLAVAQEDGLITPVVRDCGNKGIVEIEEELKDLIQRARTQKLAPEEFSDATFTISSLGPFGIEEFTAIINPPGAAILAIAEIRKEAVVQEDESLDIKSIMRMTMSCDHRVVDGAVGALFLGEMRDMMQEPIKVLY